MLFKYLKRYAIPYIVGILILYAVDKLSVYIPQYIGEVTDGLQNGSFVMSDIWHYIMLILLTGLGMAVGRFGWRFFIFGSARKVEHEIRDDLFEHLSGLSVKYYNENKTGDLMAYFTNDIAAVRMAIGPAVISSFDAVVQTILVVCKMVTYVDPRLTIMACIPMLIIFFGAIWYCRVDELYFREKNDAFSKLSDRVQESVSGIRVIKAFVQEKHDLMEFSKVNRHNMDKNMRVVRLNSIVMPLLDLIIGISGAINLIYGGYLVLAHEISLGQFVAFNQYIGILVWPMIAAGDSINSFSQGAAAIRRLKSIFDVKPEVSDLGCDPSIDTLYGEISVRALDFSYLPGIPKALSNVSVDIPAGSTLAVVGRTGSGKTTFANLLLRMYETERTGMISFDGHDIGEIPLDVLHKQIAYVPQDNFLFSDTVQANIAFGVRDNIEIEAEKFTVKTLGKSGSRLGNYLEQVEAEHYDKVDKAYNDLEEVEAAAKLACVHDNIIDFPRGYATLVGERGVTMSGGQKQRSSIARALMKNAPILILDDALSAVDTDTEEQILENLKRDRAGKTTIIIAHRISTIQNADKIMVLDEGRVIEYGSHSELMKLGGSYARMYEKQQLEKQLENTEA